MQTAAGFGESIQKVGQEHDVEAAKAWGWCLRVTPLEADTESVNFGGYDGRGRGLDLAFFNHGIGKSPVNLQVAGDLDESLRVIHADDLGTGSGQFEG
jgi:hypothetical protein